MQLDSHIKSALFIDFDNIFISLNETFGAEAAARFAGQPAAWLNFLEKVLPTDYFGGSGLSRRVLLRKCYLNPTSFGSYRPDFTIAGIEVTDCPKLTREGKTSSDIHMVIDILDALQHPTHFDEFILISADADFTPVLQRVRQHNRLSVVLAAGFTSPAYRASCDYLLPMETFLQQGLGMELKDDDEAVEPPAAPPARVANAVLDRLANLVYQRAVMGEIIPGNELPALYRRVDEFAASRSWLEFGTLKNLTRAIIARRNDLAYFNDPIRGEWWVGVKETGEAHTPAPANGQARNGIAYAETHKAIAALIIRIVHASATPVVMATLATRVKEEIGVPANGGGWYGFTSFGALLQSLDLNGLKIHHVTPGYVYDPQRHAIPDALTADLADTSGSRIEAEFKEKHPEIEALAGRIHRLTDMPYLLPEHYALVLEQVARAVNENGFNLTQTTRLVRDRCVERGAPVARAHVNFVVIGIHYAGHTLGKEDITEDPALLAEFLYTNTLNLCQSVQLALSDEEKALVRAWLVSTPQTA